MRVVFFLTEMPRAEASYENFRLWCTTCPSPIFPTAVLQNGIKMAIEPPKGLRANLVGSYSAAPIANDGYLESNSKPEKFRKLCYSLIFSTLYSKKKIVWPARLVRDAVLKLNLNLNLTDCSYPRGTSRTASTSRTCLSRCSSCNCFLRRE